MPCRFASILPANISYWRILFLISILLIVVLNSFHSPGKVLLFILWLLVKLNKTQVIWKKFPDFGAGIFEYSCVNLGEWGKKKKKVRCRKKEEIKMILSLKKPVGLGPTKTTKDESSDTHMYLWDTQNVNSIFRNIHFQRCKYLSFCWLCFYFITERISCWLYTERLEWF